MTFNIVFAQTLGSVNNQMRAEYQHRCTLAPKLGQDDPETICQTIRSGGDSPEAGYSS
jgi:hypothetical protein